MKRLDNVDDINQVTRENFKLPLACSYMALVALHGACVSIEAASVFFMEWLSTVGKSLHSATIGDAFDAIDAIKKDGIKLLNISADRVLKILPTTAKLGLMMGIDGLDACVAKVLQHMLGHIMADTPELAVLAHIHEVSSLPVIQRNIDRELAEMAAELDESEPEETWQKIGELTKQLLPGILVSPDIPVQLEAAISVCQTIGDKTAVATMLFDEYTERVSEKKKAAAAEMRETMKTAMDARAKETAHACPDADVCPGAADCAKEKKDGEPKEAAPLAGSSPRADDLPRAN